MDYKFEQFQQFLNDQNILYDKDHIKFIKSSIHGYGIENKRISKCKPDNILVTIPKTSILSIETSKLWEEINKQDQQEKQKKCMSSSKSKKKYIKKNHHQRNKYCEPMYQLAAALLFENLLSKQSKWYCYIQLLPESLKQIGSPLNENDQILKTLFQGTAIDILIPNLRKHLYNTFHLKIRDLFINRAKQLNIINLDAFRKVSFDQFILAYACVSSRAFLVDQFHQNAMVPVADLFNHKTDAEHVHIQGMSNDSDSEDESDIEISLSNGDDDFLHIDDDDDDDDDADDDDNDNDNDNDNENDDDDDDDVDSVGISKVFHYSTKINEHSENNTFCENHDSNENHSQIEEEKEEQSIPIDRTDHDTNGAASVQDIIEENHSIHHTSENQKRKRTKAQTTYANDEDKDKCKSENENENESASTRNKNKIITKDDDDENDEKERKRRLSTISDDASRCDEDNLNIVCVKEIQCGEEIFNTFGQKSNSLLYMNYGFIEKKNEYDTAFVHVNDIINIALGICQEYQKEQVAKQQKQKERCHEQEQTISNNNVQINNFLITDERKRCIQICEYVTHQQVIDDYFQISSSLNSYHGFILLFYLYFVPWVCIKDFVDDEFDLLEHITSLTIQDMIKNVPNQMKKAIMKLLTLQNNKFPVNTTLQSDELLLHSSKFQNHSNNLVLNDMERLEFIALNIRIGQRKAMQNAYNKLISIIERKDDDVDDEEGDCHSEFSDSSNDVGANGDDDESEIEEPKLKRSRIE